jgi:hypothetical protein
VASAAQAEAHACAEAVAAGVGWGMTNVHIESDSQNLICAIQSKDYDLAPKGIIYRDIRLSLSLSFDSVYYSSIPRECNKIAHCLAAYGADKQDCRSLWSELLPDDVGVMVASSLAVSGV